MDLTHLTITEMQQQLDSGALRSVDLTQAFLDRIEQTDARINAFITRCPQQALQAAERADAARAAGPVAPLCGIPLALKDVLVTEGVRTTCASKILGDFVPPYDATVVRRLKAQGAVILGKLNMDEFAMGSSSENSAFGPVRNPWNTDCVPGGSSGGSAACVAARQAPASLGTDTGGSIRQPASHCGVVGLKPTYGRVSRYGMIAFASSLDQIGPLTRSVRDSALLLGAIAGHDPADSTSARVEVPDYLATLAQGVAGLRIGLPREYFIEGLDPQVRAALEAALATYRELGAELVEISLPHTEYAVACYYLVATAEASSNLARFDGVRYGARVDAGKGLAALYSATRSQGFGDEVKRRIMLGTYALSSGYYDAYYLKAQKVRTLIRQDFERAFAEVDCILTPVAPTPAFALGEKAQDPLTMYLSDIFTLSANLAGICGLSLPCGLSAAGLPIGLQLLGRPFGEATLLRCGQAFEQATAWHQRLAPL
ncbi:Asp-tRNA(Asn)/Glu-tRNA(Gln) amidotransferase subunit GatA [Desulfuromonas thiophila]|uniref:Glutamyl-tRNA(Gln) amidotransferase subunit A n=1 Tax=Desulfuromonas thiophila TaxID=57664 RepID=A0A1G6XNI8_9BACT|nr:Asp-tRNA(Asn)/Glu-tRNA(Gln) amidotransferase subunit GatA [Desulfuromonas thiophila]SDD79754.1 aspartyl/glutamyl-tRNA(Asn/Gln) amidotransferase subunit A [Desulfuromonas thiophila]